MLGQEAVFLLQLVGADDSLTASAAPVVGRDFSLPLVTGAGIKQGVDVIFPILAKVNLTVGAIDDLQVGRLSGGF